MDTWPLMAREATAKLLDGQVATFNPRGNSMRPHIMSGDAVTMKPVDRDPVEGDIVLCHVNGVFYVHIVKQVRNGSYQIGNAHGRINGWIPKDRIFGLCTSHSTS